MSGAPRYCAAVVEQACPEGFGVEYMELGVLEGNSPLVLDRHLAMRPRTMRRGFGFASLIAR